MHEELNRLMKLMGEARMASDQANNRAYELRQAAVRLQFEATSAADTATLTAELLTAATDNNLILKLAQASREAIRKIIHSTELAAIAVEKANEADLIVTSAFQHCRAAASDLLLALDDVETRLTAQLTD